LPFVLLLTLACNLPGAAGAVATPGVTAPVPTGVPDATEAPIPIVDVPVSVIQIMGAPYQSYQMPGDSFHFVCAEPCSIDPQLIFAEYAGFRNARTRIVQLTGVDILPELGSVEIHLQFDPVCGYEMGNGGYARWYPGETALICDFFFESTADSIGPLATPENATHLDQQWLFIHEYLHMLFFGRLAHEVEAMHDFVTPLATYITYLQPDGSQGPSGIGDLCAYYTQSPPGDFGGYLFLNLCAQNGFNVEKLSAAMVELDSLYQSGAGQAQQPGYAHPSVSPNQFREILNRVTGSDTRQAFIDACWPASLFGDTYTLSDACLYPTPTAVPTRVQ
jgi:hypothetical protein